MQCNLDQRVLLYFAFENIGNTSKMQVLLNDVQDAMLSQRSAMRAYKATGERHHFHEEIPLDLEQTN